MSDRIAVFLNDRMVWAAPGSSVRELVEAEEPALGSAVAGGTAVVTDGRGIALGADSPVFPGAIVRVAARARRPRDEADGHS